jgi:hypothetical protein
VLVEYHRTWLEVEDPLYLCTVYAIPGSVWLPSKDIEGNPIKDRIRIGFPLRQGGAEIGAIASNATFTVEKNRRFRLVFKYKHIADGKGMLESPSFSRGEEYEIDLEDPGLKVGTEKTRFKVVDKEPVGNQIWIKKDRTCQVPPEHKNKRIMAHGKAILPEAVFMPGGELGLVTIHSVGVDTNGEIAYCRISHCKVVPIPFNRESENLAIDFEYDPANVEITELGVGNEA